MTTSVYSSLKDTDYPAIRRVLRDDYQRLDDEALEDIVMEIFPGTNPDDVENFMRSLQKFGRQAAPLAQQALPGVIQGAVTGGMMGGPVGLVAGGLLGGTSSLLASPQSAPAQMAQTKQPALAPAAPSPAAPSPAASPGARPMQGAPGSAALSQLLFLLSQPETMRALASLQLPGVGRPTQQVANREVPALAFANAISELAGEIAESYAVVEQDSISDYLFDELGNARGDIFNPVDRAALLVADLAQVSAAEAALEAEDEMDTLESDDYEYDDYDDEYDDDEYDDDEYDDDEYDDDEYDGR